MRTRKEIKSYYKGEDTVKFINFLQLGWCGYVERMQNQGVPKQISNAGVEGIRKRGLPHKRRRDEVEKGYNIMGKKQAGCGQRSSGMEEDCIGSQGR